MTDGASESLDQNGIVPDYAMIILRDAPLSSYNGGLPGLAPTMPSPGHKLDLHSPAAAAYSNYLANQRGLSKGWLRANAPEVQVVYEYSIVLNGFAIKLNNHPMWHLANIPNAAHFGFSYSHTIQMDISPQLINAPVLWNKVGGQANAGAGIKIGIIDTGIDYLHPFLTDTTLPALAGFPKCDAIDSNVGQPDTSCKFVSNKVIVAKVFETRTDFDAHAAQAHGTHVSGIAAGVAGTCAPLIPCGLRTLSGIAPKAYLGNYNVFPGNVVSASDHDISDAVETAVADGMDVLNLSLGGTAHPNDELANAVNHAVDAGVIVAVAAGNAGPGLETISSPGTAAQVITAGASTDPHFVGIPVTVPNLGTFGGALGEFANFPTGGITAPYATTSPSTACLALPAGSLSGMIALIARGACSFSTKIRDAQNAGALGTIVYNNVAGDPVAMAQDGTPSQPVIPAVMVSKSNGLAMVTNIPKTVTATGSPIQEFVTSNADILAGFSSRGPPVLETPADSAQSGVLDKIKPDVTAPGVNVYSSVPPFACATPPCYAFFSGTSMATPHVAGSAAVLKQLHPDWSPAQIKSALVNTAHRPVGSSSTGLSTNNPMNRGGGRIDLGAASNANATVDTNIGQPSISFGVIPPRSGQTSSVTFTLTSVTSTAVTYTVAAVCFSCGPGVTTDVSSLTVAGGGTGTVTVTLSTDASLPVGFYYGDITLTGGNGAVLKVPYWVQLDLPNHLLGFPSGRLR